MTVSGCWALCWATFVLLLLLWTTTAAAPFVPVRRYRLGLLQRRVKGETSKPEVNQNRKQSSKKPAADAVPATKHTHYVVAGHDADKLLPVVAFLKALTKQKNKKKKKPSDTQRTTAELEIKSTTGKKRGIKKVSARQGDEYYDKPYPDDDYGQSYDYPNKNPYPADSGHSYPEDPYPDSGGGYEQDGGYGEYSDDTYSDDSYHEAEYQGEDNYHESSDGYQEAAPDHHDGGDAYHDPVPDGYQETHDSGYSDSSYPEQSGGDDYGHDPRYQDSGSDGYDHGDHDSAGYDDSSHSDSSYPEQSGYQDSGDGYGDGQDYQQPAYHESEPDGHHDGHDSGDGDDSHSGSSYPEQAGDHGDGYSYEPEYSESDGHHDVQDSGYGDDSYSDSAGDGYDDKGEYDDSYPQPYQLPHQQPSYESNSYQPDYQPTYSSSGNDESASYHDYDSDSYPEASHNKDYNCPSAPGKIRSLQLVKPNRPTLSPPTSTRLKCRVESRRRCVVCTHPSEVVTQFTISCAVELLRSVTSDDIMT